MIRLAPDVPTVTALAAQLSVRPSTLMSRFARAGLPSPKNYLAAIRLLHAAYLFETSGLSVADVAYRLEYSSPQSFGRHLRAMLGLTALEFRRRFPFPVALERFVELMIEPYREIWRGFHPVAGVQGGRMGGGSGGSGAAGAVPTECCPTSRTSAALLAAPSCGSAGTTIPVCAASWSARRASS